MSESPSGPPPALDTERPVTGGNGWRVRLVGALTDELDFLCARVNRSDAVDETLLCLVESAVLAAKAAVCVHSSLVDAVRVSALTDMLAAARAAVVSASYAVTSYGNHGESAPGQPIATSNRHGS